MPAASAISRADGDMDTCIVLRTALVKDGMMYVQAGAGIVADSDPASEQQECINKAKALFRAAEEARRFASAAAQGAVARKHRMRPAAAGTPDARPLDRNARADLLITSSASATTICGSSMPSAFAVCMLMAR